MEQSRNKRHGWVNVVVRKGIELGHDNTFLITGLMQQDGSFFPGYQGTYDEINKPHQTEPLKHVPNPEWNQKTSYLLGNKSPQDLKVEVWDKHALSKEYAGEVVVHLGDVLKHGIVNLELPLVHGEAHKKKKKASVTGKIVLEMTFTDETYIKQRMSALTGKYKLQGTTDWAEKSCTFEGEVNIKGDEDLGKIEGTGVKRFPKNSSTPTVMDQFKGDWEPGELVGIAIRVDVRGLAESGNYHATEFTFDLDKPDRVIIKGRVKGPWAGSSWGTGDGTFDWNFDKI